MIRKQKGFNLVEVLVSILLATIGVLGFISLGMRMQSSELETVQREEATRQLNYIVGQVKANRDALSCYVLTDLITSTNKWAGFKSDFDVTPYTCNVAGNIQTQKQVSSDIMSWDHMLKGGLVQLNPGSGLVNVGGIIGARGCISRLPAPNDDTLLIELAWQGSEPSGVSASKCASGQYGNDNLRRIISTEVRVAIYD